jgi:transcription elongation factor SPT5
MPTGVENDDRRHRELDRQRQREQDLDAEQQAEALRQKYGRQARAAAVEVSTIPQHLLLPSVDDPMIWAVRCKPGKEPEVVNSILKRYVESMGTKNAVDISAAFARGGTMAGYIYVEARKQDAVMKATENIINCYPHTKMSLMPIGEMPDLLRVRAPKRIEINQYVRVRRPQGYSGDLAQIVGVDGTGTEVTVRIVPRIDYELDSDITGNQKRKRPGGGPRPAQKLFNEVDAKRKLGHRLHLISGSGGNRVLQFKNDKYENGFLLKDLKLNMLQIEEVNPTLEEMSMFATNGLADGDPDVAFIAATLRQSAPTAEFLPNDMVQIHTGEQQGVTGRTSNVTGDIVTFKVTEGLLKGQTIEAPIKTLRKLFKVGDQVKVTGQSKYHDEVGMVTRVKDDRVTMLTNANNEEITVFSRDLRAAMDSAGPVGASKYDLFDLVRLDVSTVGCVVRVDRETIKVLDQNDSSRVIFPSKISGRVENRYPIATDRAGNEIRREDTVKEAAGLQRTGEVLHVHQNYLWLRNRMLLNDNTGVFVVRSNGVNVTSAKGGRLLDSATPDLTKMNPDMMRKNPLNGNGMMPPPRMQGRDNLLGKHIRVKLGPYKGYMGIVKDTTQTTARLELYTKKNILSVDKAHLVVIDPVTKQPLQSGPPGRRPGSWGSGSGNMGSLPSRTPMGSRTPAGAAGASRATPWGASGGATPSWGGAGSGNRTPWGGSGSRTPFGAGADGSRTVNPYASGNDGSRTAYGGSSGWGSGSKTPMYSSNSAPTPGASGSSSWGASGAASAATPAAFDTPAAFEAPTPAADMPTPRNPYSYQTPGVAATPGAFAETPAAFQPETPAPFQPETPAAFQPETPAAFGEDDDEPRYT